jgi:hypothetical protein
MHPGCQTEEDATQTGFHSTSGVMVPTGKKGPPPERPEPGNPQSQDMKIISSCSQGWRREFYKVI